MISGIKARIEHARDILVFPAWNRVILGSVALLGTADTVRVHIYPKLPNVPHLPLAWWIVIFLLALIVFIFEASYRKHKKLKEKLEKLDEKRIRLEILNVRFDQNLTTELYIEFRITNVGVPTTARNWKTLTRRKTGEIVSLNHRYLITDKLVPNILGNGVVSDDMTRIPIVQGEVRKGTLVFTINGENAKEVFGYDSNIFTVSVQDSGNDIIEAVYQYHHVNHR
jgi:hypothetical protein